MKNVLFVASDNSRTSGAFLCMVKLCELLRDNYGCNLIVVLPGIGDGAPLLEKIGVKTIMVKSCTWAVPMEWKPIHKLYFSLKMIVYNYPAVNAIRKIIRNEKIDIVHINTSWTYAGAMAALKENVKLVWHLRELLEEDQKRRIVFRRWGYSLINRADMIFAVSDFVKNKYRRFFKNKVITIYDGIEETEFVKDHSIFSSEQVTILCLGLVCEQKGQWQVIEACRKLRSFGIDNFELKIVGRVSDEYKKELIEMIRCDGLQENITFCGETQDVARYYHEADIFVMSSHAEAFGRTTVEAMMSGCLVIGAKSGATPELLNHGECGLLFERGNVGELADKLIYALKNRKEAMDMAKVGQKFALDNFTADIDARRVFEKYRMILSDTR